MKKFAEYLEESLAAEIKSEPKSAAARQARKMGLTYVGFGRYTDNKGRVAYIVHDGRLVPFRGQEEVGRMYDKATMTTDLKKSNEISKQADSHAIAINNRHKEDQKILSQKEKEAIKTANQLGSFYRPEMFDDVELNAIQSYTGDTVTQVNRYLYKGHDEGTDANTADFVEQMVDALDSAFDETQAPFPFTVYSGLSGRYKADKIKPGQEYIFRGFLSTSLSHDVAISGFTDSSEAVVLQIEVNKGQKAIYVDSISSVDGELETILPRGSKIKVVSGPHPLPMDAIRDDEEGQSRIQLFHCTLIQDL